MPENRLISLDWAMKRLLRSKSNFEILEGFLTELIYKEENDKIEEEESKKYLKIEEILESEANREKENDKFNRVDIKLKNSDGEIVIVEIQFSSQYDYFQRMLYGVSKTVTEHLKLGSDYGNIVKVISVNIIYFDLGVGDDYLYHGKTLFKGINRDDTLKLSTRSQNRFGKTKVSELYPEYFVIKVNKFNDIAKNSLDEWIYFLKNEEIKSNFSAKGLDKAKETLDIMQLKGKDRLRYERYIERRRDERSYAITKEIEIEEAIEKGIKQGEKKGQKKEKILIAKNLLMQGLDTNIIINATGLSIEEIEKLKKE